MVGCLWPSARVEVASEFHRLLMRPGVAAWGGGAVLSLREEYMDVPLCWAQFVHYGT